MVPFAGAIAFLLAALTVLAAGKTVPALIIVVAGFLTTFSADHFVRPSLIGGTTKLPFIWVLLGILGGVETFACSACSSDRPSWAALILLWREIAGEDAARRRIASRRDTRRAIRIIVQRCLDAIAVRERRAQFNKDRS